MKSKTKVLFLLSFPLLFLNCRGSGNYTNTMYDYNVNNTSFLGPQYRQTLSKYKEIKEEKVQLSRPECAEYYQNLKLGDYKEIHNALMKDDICKNYCKPNLKLLNNNYDDKDKFSDDWRCKENPRAIKINVMPIALPDNWNNKRINKKKICRKLKDSGFRGVIIAGNKHKKSHCF